MPRWCFGIIRGRLWGGPTLSMCSIIRWEHPAEKPVRHHRRPASREPDIERSDQAAPTKPLGKSPSILRMRRTGMVLPLSFLLFVLLANDLDQTSATPCTFRGGAGPIAPCTVQKFPTQACPLGTQLNPSKMRSHLKNFSVVNLWVPVCGQNLKAIPFQLFAESFERDS